MAPVGAYDNTGTPGVPAVILTHTYDAVGNVTRVEDSDGVTVASTYDERNLLVRRDCFGGPGEGVRVDFAYDERGDNHLLLRQLSRNGMTVRYDQ